MSEGSRRMTEREILEDAGDAEALAEYDAITSTIDATLAKGEDTLDPIARRLYKAALEGDRAEVRRIRDEIKAEDNDIARGMTFTVKRDATDPRWDIVIIRLPNADFHNRDRPELQHIKPTPECDLRGDKARWRFVRWAIATVAGLCEMLGAPPEFTVALKLLYREAQVQGAQADADA